MKELCLLQRRHARASSRKMLRYQYGRYVGQRCGTVRLDRYFRLYPAGGRGTFEYFASQNVAIKVISGDNPVTVSNIAVKAGLEGGEEVYRCQYAAGGF